MHSKPTDVVIVGAGPYGLSIAAYLDERCIDYRIFGKPMQSWLDRPRRTFLKSLGFATNIYTPARSCDFVDYCTERGLEAVEPCAIPDFARYGLWAQHQAVGRLTPVDVAAVSRQDEGFIVRLVNGQTVPARKVIVASGIGSYARMPAALADLPGQLVSHTWTLTDFAGLEGKDVCVVGGGQSALEAAALLREAGARPQLLVRGESLRFSTRMPERRTLWERVRWPQSVLGPGLRSRALQMFPAAFFLMPERWRLRMVATFLGPMGAWWLRDRVEGKLPIRLRSEIVSAVVRDGRLALRVREAGLAAGLAESEIVCDHVVAGTGYEIDVDKLGFLDVGIRQAVRRSGRGPSLTRRFESSVPGLFFVGTASSLSFGPLFRFVAGAEFTARIVASYLGRDCRAVGREQMSRAPRSKQAVS